MSGIPAIDRSLSKSPATGDSALSRASHSTQSAVSRTIAILAKAACKTHRVAIQSRITSAGFDILAERIEEWSVPSDLDFLEAFLGSEAEHRDAWIPRLSGGPIYVMVLERHRAAERWQTMCGPDLGDDGKQAELYDGDGMLVVPSGLRAQYGAAALYASPPDLAPRQLAICFPELADPEAAAALRAADEEEQRATLAAMGSDGGFLVREDDDIVYDEEGRAFDAHSGEPLELHQDITLYRDSSVSEVSPGSGDNGEKRKDAADSGQRVFRARPLPKSLAKPSTQPRLSRAAALRMGIKLPDPPRRTGSQLSSSNTDGTANVGISGLPKQAVALPKSLAAPALAPRMNKSAAARANGGAGDTAAGSVRERKPVDFSNTPGHKRASLGGSQLASLMAPPVAPRLNKAAAARVAAQKGSAETGANNGKPSQTLSRASTSRPSQVRAARSSTTASATGSAERKPVDFSNTPGHKRTSVAGTSTLKSLQAPSIAPRGNRASISRGSAVSAGPPSSMSSGNSAAASTPRNRPWILDNAGLKPRASDKENAPSSSSSIKAGNPTSGQKYERERKPIDFSNTPGHKRTSQVAAIASLAKPSIQPRSNAAAQRRLSVGGATSGSQVQNNEGRATSVLGQSTSATGNGGRPSSRISADSSPAASTLQRKSTRAAAPPSSFRA